MMNKKTGKMMAKGLGVFSLGLGLAELVFPKKFGNTLGLKKKDNLVRAYGARELSNGVALLATRNPVPWLWTRVAGDGIDLATLGYGAWRDRSKRKYVAGAAAAVLGVAVLDLLSARTLSRT